MESNESNVSSNTYLTTHKKPCTSNSSSDIDRNVDVHDNFVDENETNSDFNKVLSVHLKPITSHSRSDPDENVDLYKNYFMDTDESDCDSNIDITRHIKTFYEHSK